MKLLEEILFQQVEKPGRMGVYQEDKKGRKHTGSLGTVARSQPD